MKVEANGCILRFEVKTDSIKLWIGLVTVQEMRKMPRKLLRYICLMQPKGSFGLGNPKKEPGVFLEGNYI